MNIHNSAPVSMPFQPVNSRNDYGNSDSLYQQRLSERASLDNNYGAASTSYPQQMPMAPQQMQMPPHPAVLATFLSLDPVAQQRFAMANPVAFAQLSVAARQTPGAGVPIQENSGMELETAREPRSSSKSKHKSRKEGLAQGIKSRVNIHANIQNEDNESWSKSGTHRTRDHRHQTRKEVQSDTESEFENAHSSDEEFNAPRQGNGEEHFLQIDFRNNIRDSALNGGYVLSTPSMKVKEIELVTCVVNRTPLLDKEPYIYIAIDEIPGDYKIMSENNKLLSVFGKLTPEKTVNEFIFYRTDNCKKTFSQPISIDQLTVTLLQYDHTPISLSKLQVRDLSHGKSYYRIHTRGAHYMSSGDSLNITRKGLNKVTVESVMVIDVPTPDTIVTECPMTDIGPEERCSFERVQIKCSLTFKIRN